MFFAKNNIYKSLTASTMLVLLLLAAPVLAQPEVPVKDARLTRVKVYPGLAQLTLEAQVQVSPGEQLLVVQGLSQFADDQSVAVKGSGTSQGVFLSVSARMNHLEDLKGDARLTRLRDSLKLLDRLREDLTEAQYVLDQEQSLILANQKFGGSEQGLTGEQLVQMAELFRTRLLAIREKKMGVDEKAADLAKNRSRVEREYNDLRALRDRPGKEVRIAYRASTAGTLNLELTYICSNAGWTPRYDLRATPGETALLLQLYGQVVNNTGVNWNGILLSLSTAQPTQAADVPVMDPAYLSIYEPVRYETTATRKNAPHRDQVQFTPPPVVADEEAPAPAMLEIASETTADYTRTRTSDLFMDFDITLKQDVPADGKVYEVAVKDYDLEAQLRYAATPYTEAAAYLEARLTGWQQLSLPAGRANVFYDQVFVGKTDLTAPTVADTLSIGLGRDPKVMVKRTRVSDFTGVKTIGTARRVTQAWAVSLKNTQKQDITIEVRERYPVSTDSRIEVSLLESPGAEVTAPAGYLTWRLTLAPGEEKTLKESWEIKYPKDLAVEGL